MVGMSYREHPPPPALAPWLECLWERAGERGAPVRVLPDGCIDVVWMQAGDTRLVGANTTAFLVAPAPGTRVIGARMRPGGAPALLGIDAEQVRDDRPELGAVLGDEGARLAAALDDGEDPLATLVGWLEARRDGGTTHPPARSPDPVVAAAVDRLARRADGVGRLGDALGVSERALRRRVTAAVGYGPKRLGRVLRLRRALAAAAPGTELAELAYGAGYADQAHFSNDCRELAGVSPSALLGGRR
jgi:AraC-like DNA-binding protein